MGGSLGWIGQQFGHERIDGRYILPVIAIEQYLSLICRNGQDIGQAQFAQVLALPSDKATVHLIGDRGELLADKVRHQQSRQYTQFYDRVSRNIIEIVQRIELSIVNEYKCIS